MDGWMDGWMDGRGTRTDLRQSLLRRQTHRDYLYKYLPLSACISRELSISTKALTDTIRLHRATCIVILGRGRD